MKGSLNTQSSSFMTIINTEGHEGSSSHEKKGGLKQQRKVMGNSAGEQASELCKEPHKRVLLS